MSDFNYFTDNEKLCAVKFTGRTRLKIIYDDWDEKFIRSSLLKTLRPVFGELDIEIDDVKIKEIKAIKNEKQE